MEITPLPGKKPSRSFGYLPGYLNPDRVTLQASYNFNFAVVLVVTTNAGLRLKILVSEMTCCVPGRTLNSADSAYNLVKQLVNVLLQGPPYNIRGCILTIVERMDEEFVKMLQACDAHSTEYIVRCVSSLNWHCSVILHCCNMTAPEYLQTPPTESI